MQRFLEHIRISASRVYALEPCFAAIPGRKTAHTFGSIALASAAAILLWGAIFAPFAQAQDNTGIAPGEWTLKCDAANRCELGSTLKINGATAGRLLIYQVGQKTLLEYLLPLRLNFLKNISILIDRKSIFPTKALYCDAPGCVGFAELDASLLAAMKSGKKLELVFALVGEDKQYAFPFTLMGFTKSHMEYSSLNRK